MTQPTESQDEDSEDTSAASAGASGGVVDVFSGVSIRVRTDYFIDVISTLINWLFYNCMT